MPQSKMTSREFHNQKECQGVAQSKGTPGTGTIKGLPETAGITPVRGFHKLTCPPLYRLALMLVFGLCVWKWTSSVTTLDPNQGCSIGFDGSASGIAQSLA